MKKPTGVSWDETGVPDALEDEPLWKRPVFLLGQRSLMRSFSGAKPPLLDRRP
jgi:hypothetical protein